MDLLVEARSLVKKYQTVTAINGIHLEVHSGRSLGLLGPKDSGKSSLLKLIYCGSEVSAGELFVFGLNVKGNFKKIRSQLGVVPSGMDFEEEMCVFDNLLLYARYFGLSTGQAKVRIKATLRFLNLVEHESAFIDALDKTTQRLLLIARSLINRPKLLILDEPTKGLSSEQSFVVWKVLKKLKSEGITLLVASPKVLEVETLTDEIVLMDKGKILLSGDPQKIVSDRIGHEVVDFYVHTEDLEYYLKKIRERFAYQVINGRIRLFVDDGQDSRSALDLISSDNIIVRKASLEDVFLRLSGYELK